MKTDYDDLIKLLSFILLSKSYLSKRNQVQFLKVTLHKVTTCEELFC